MPEVGPENGIRLRDHLVRVSASAEQVGQFISQLTVGETSSLELTPESAGVFTGTKQQRAGYDSYVRYDRDRLNGWRGWSETADDLSVVYTATPNTTAALEITKGWSVPSRALVLDGGKLAVKGVLFSDEPIGKQIARGKKVHVQNLRLSHGSSLKRVFKGIILINREENEDF